ncbi:hypothetical protein [Nocardioides jejuensis]|uniref:DUF1097 domain-containing protein n=1 Tax=Nocardioides jejuensis TaxID=2502782 RepID=A0A4R1CL46_9ACTN|nr:hypothetical protein [Nocardioides jejuensis]TCJ30936.1 hypothetical protein EPD65_02550 [Nocardioides jejuensis]
MRVNLLSGLLLTVAAVLVAGPGAALDSGLGAVALAGLGAGAVLGLVPDHGLPARLAGFTIGLVLSWAAYAARAALLPDSTSGRVVAIALVVALATVAVSVLRLPLWPALLGAATLAGTYEAAYTDAPSQVATTSMNAVTALLVPLVLGVLAAVAGGVLETLAGRASAASKAHTEVTR